MRKTYIKNNNLSVLDDFIASLGDIEMGGEIINTQDALGRVTKKAIYAKYSDPMYNAAAMDGIAVVAENTHFASEQHPLILKENKDFIYINTGDVITGNYDAVIMIEDCLIVDGGVALTAPAYPWQHVRVKGESIVASEMVLASGRPIRAVDIGAIIASGNMQIEVVKKPCVGIIPTGKEMVNDPSLLGVGKIMESNSKMFAALAKESGAHHVCYDIVPDDILTLMDSIRLATKENDIVIVNAGSSAGTKDYTVTAIERLGSIYAHGFAIKPGKPTILGIVNQKPIIGIPGYPVSAYIVFDTFLRPIINKMGARLETATNTISARLTRTVNSSFKNTEILRMSVGCVDGNLVTTPLERGAAQIMSLVKADGLLRIDRFKEGIVGGTMVDIELKKPLSQIENMLVVIGSNDLVIDIIADNMPLTSAHVGSMGGIMALASGECHIAPIHLLDTTTGQYNISYIKKYFAGKKMALIKGLGRIQGFIVPKGNPNNIRTFEDIKGLRFANRQRGAGTRILFDYYLQQHDISTSEINGYEKEYNTHLAVAMAIDSGSADVGMGIQSAAINMGMDFISIASEEYDFLTTYERLNDKKVKHFINIITSDSFKQQVSSIGGYTADNIGEIILVE